MKYSHSKAMAVFYKIVKLVKNGTSFKNRKKRYTQINGNIAICQKANQQFNWHGDFVFEDIENAEFNERLAKLWLCFIKLSSW
jgi:hypothetical protein